MTYLIKNPVPKDVNMIYCFSSTSSWQPGTNGNYIYPLNKIIKSGNSNVTLNTSTYELNLSNKIIQLYEQIEIRANNIFVVVFESWYCHFVFFNLV